MNFEEVAAGHPYFLRVVASFESDGSERKVIRKVNSWRKGCMNQLHQITISTLPLFFESAGWYTFFSVFNFISPVS